MSFSQNVVLQYRGQPAKGFGFANAKLRFAFLVFLAAPTCRNYEINNLHNVLRIPSIFIFLLYLNLFLTISHNKLKLSKITFPTQWIRFKLKRVMYIFIQWLEKFLTCRVDYHLAKITSRALRKRRHRKLALVNLDYFCGVTKGDNANSVLHNNRASMSSV